MNCGIRNKSVRGQAPAAEAVSRGMRMRAGVFCGPMRLAVQEVPVPEVAPGSLLVRVRACAVCGSDLRIYRDGNPRIVPPRILGHEIAGEVAAAGKGVRRFRPGDRVCVGADIPCGRCLQCRSGRGNCCETNLAVGYQIDGGFAQYVFLPPQAVARGPVRKISSGLDFDVAALAEPLACCINGYERGLMRPGHSVVIFGAGPMGAMLAALGRKMGAARIIVVDICRERLERIKAFGVDAVIDPRGGDTVDRVMGLTEGLGADLVFTACPAVETHEPAIAMVARRGVVNLFGGLSKTAPPIRLFSNHLHYREAYVTGSHGSTPQQHSRALGLIERRALRLDPVISHRFNLNSLQKAFTTAESGQAWKVIIRPNG